MPRPSANHQWSYNKSGLPVVDVVVDPHLTSHLRPHQRDGLLFLYECVMGMRYGGACGMELCNCGSRMINRDLVYEYVLIFDVCLYQSCVSLRGHPS